jgi:hypothetical protein
MQEYALGVGDELVIDCHVRLTLLAVEGDEVLLAVAAPEPDDVRASEPRQRYGRLSVKPGPLPGEN